MIAVEFRAASRASRQRRAPVALSTARLSAWLHCGSVVFNAWGRLLEGERRAMSVAPDFVELLDVTVHPEGPQDSPAGSSDQVP